MGRTTARLAVMVGAAAGLLLMPTASFGAVTIGSDLMRQPTEGFWFPSGGTDFQTALPGRQVTAPANGVVVRWRIRTGIEQTSQPVALRVVRPIGGNQFTGAGTSGGTVSPGGATQTFDARLPIRAGDYVGLDLGPGTEASALMVSVPVAGASDSYFAPRLNDGETRTPESESGYENTYNADIEPDADADGFGDETQDQCATDASRQTACAPSNQALRAQAVKQCKRKLKGKRGAARRRALKSYKRCVKKAKRRYPI